jgi:O-antigen ligase
VVLSSLLLFSRRVQIMVFGGGEHASSNESRATQWDNAFNAFPQSPVFGFGYSQATRVAGVPGRLGESTVLDSWYINVLMDSGVLGAALYLSAFVAATYRAFQLSVLMKGRDAALMMALASMMIAKMTINSVLSLTHNQVLLFFAYGIVIGASLRYQDQLKDFRWFPGRDEKAATI